MHARLADREHNPANRDERRHEDADGKQGEQRQAGERDEQRKQRPSRRRPVEPRGKQGENERHESQCDDPHDHREGLRIGFEDGRAPGALNHGAGLTAQCLAGGAVGRKHEDQEQQQHHREHIDEAENLCTDVRATCHADLLALLTGHDREPYTDRVIKSSDQRKGVRKPVGDERRPARPAPSTPAASRAGQPEINPRPLRRRQRRNEAGDLMRARIVDAALRTLISTGYANTSVRAVASTGAFSPALVFYHFGSVDALLLAVLDRVSGERLSRYQTRLAEVSNLQALGAAMEELYAEDLHLGQLTAVQEIVGAMAFDPELGAEIVERMQAWMTFAE